MENNFIFFQFWLLVIFKLNIACKSFLSYYMKTKSCLLDQFYCLFNKAAVLLSPEWLQNPSLPSLHPTLPGVKMTHQDGHHERLTTGQSGSLVTLS